MDGKSPDYADLLRSVADEDRAPFIAAELKRLKLKYKTACSSVYCDIGRCDSRVAFYADINDARQIAALLSFASALRGQKSAALRLIFDGDDGGFSCDGVRELYAVIPRSDISGLGCCYGIAAAGRLDFTLGAVRGEWQTYPDIVSAAKKYGLSVNRSGDIYSVRYYDKASCEIAMLDIERLAQKFDETYSADHMLTVTRNYPPLRNDAFCVDRARSAGNVALVAPSQDSFAAASCLDSVDGCAVFVGQSAAEAIVPLFLKLAYCGTN